MMYCLCIIVVVTVYSRRTLKYDNYTICEEKFWFVLWIKFEIYIIVVYGIEIITTK